MKIIKSGVNPPKESQKLLNLFKHFARKNKKFGSLEVKDKTIKK